MHSQLARSGQLRKGEARSSLDLATTDVRRPVFGALKAVASELVICERLSNAVLVRRDHRAVLYDWSAWERECEGTVSMDVQCGGRRSEIRTQTYLAGSSARQR